MQKKVGKWSGRKVGVILDRVAREELTRKIYNYKPRESLSQVMQTSEGRLWYTAGTASQGQSGKILRLFVNGAE
jgi:hypothetical protein